MKTAETYLFVTETTGIVSKHETTYGAARLCRMVATAYVVRSSDKKAVAFWNDDLRMVRATVNATPAEREAIEAVA